MAPKRAPKINKKLPDKSKIKKLIALRDEVLRLCKEVGKACDEDREINIDGNGVNCYKALLILKPLKKLADKYK